MTGFGVGTKTGVGTATKKVGTATTKAIGIVASEADVKMDESGSDRSFCRVAVIFHSDCSNANQSAKTKESAFTRSSFP